MMEQRIEETAEELFFTYGLKGVSMDDIARNAGVSKKTIYQHFSDKKAVVLNVVSKLVASQEEQLKINLKKSENAVQEILLIAETLQQLISRLRPIVLFDLHKYFPESWELMQHFKEESLRTALTLNLQKGIAEGLYRKDLDFDITSQFALIQFNSFFKQDNYPHTHFKTDTVVNRVTELFLHGIGSAKGQTVIRKYFDKKKHEQI